MEEEFKRYYYKFRMSMPLELKIGYTRKRIRDFYKQRKEKGLGLGEIMDYCGISYSHNSEQLNLF